MPRRWAKIFRQGNAVYQLNILGNAAIASIERRFIAEVGYDVRTIRILRLVGDNPAITFGETIVATGLERSLASRLIQFLVRNGLVERQNDENDARRFSLFITPVGASVRARADMISERALELLFQRLAPAETAAFIETMERLADWIDSDDYLQQIEAMFDSLPARASEAQHKTQP